MREITINTNTFDSCMDTLGIVARSLREKREDGLSRTVEHVINSLNIASVDLLIAQKRGIELIRNEGIDLIRKGDE
jgi:hypothetical protein